MDFAPAEMRYRYIHRQFTSRHASRVWYSNWDRRLPRVLELYDRHLGPTTANGTMGTATLTTHRSHRELPPNSPATSTNVLQVGTETEDNGISTWIERKIMGDLILTSHQ